MTEQRVNDSPRNVRVRLMLEGGHCQEVDLQEGSTELTELFQILVNRNRAADKSAERFFQLPVDGGTEAFSFNSSRLIGISTRPPVVVQAEHRPNSGPNNYGETQLTAQRVARPWHMVIDDFLSPYEHQDMLAFAAQNQDKFAPGTVATGEGTHRQNLVILDFSVYPHSRLVCNRLLTWFPFILKKLGLAPFPVHQLESQLTASNDGHYYRTHLDIDQNAEVNRALTCVYYFGRQPRQFSGGELRLFDQWIEPQTFLEIDPKPNRMVVFPSERAHELMPIRCPSKKFEDSRFAITSWIWRAREPNPDATFGWGKLRCGSVPENFRQSADQSS